MKNIKSVKLKTKDAKYKIFLVSIFCFSLFAFRFSVAHGYTLIESLPGLSSQNVSLSSYLGWLFPFALTVTAVLAVIMIVIGGLEIVGGGNEGLKTSGKKKIEGAIYGLLLAVSAYLILYTINPDLVNMNLGIDPVSIKQQDRGVGVTPGTTVSVTFDALNGPYTTREKCEAGGIKTVGDRFKSAIFVGGKCTWFYNK